MLYTLLLVAILFAGCEVLDDNNVNPDNNQTQQPNDGNDYAEKPGDEGINKDDVVNASYKVYVYNLAGWEPLYIYMWDKLTETEYVGEWRGTEIKETQEINNHTYNVFEIPVEANGREVGIIFNNSNGLQTPDWFITINKDYYMFLIGTSTPTLIEDMNNPIFPELDKIYYTSTDGKVVTIHYDDYYAHFGANMISNTYDTVEGRGVMVFDKTISRIGSSTFNHCLNLESIIIPNSVTSLGDSAFSGCSNLTNVVLSNKITTIPDDCFNGTGLEVIIFPDHITSIGGSAFMGCRNLLEVTIPTSITSIGSMAFYGCSSLRKVTINCQLEGHHHSVFEHCINLARFDGHCSLISEDRRCIIYEGELLDFLCCGLTEYKIPDAVTHIGSSAFNGCCSNLTSITIPRSVTSMAPYALYGCSGLSSIYCMPTTPPNHTNIHTFDNVPKDCTIYVPFDSVDKYKENPEWGGVFENIVGYHFD